MRLSDRAFGCRGYACAAVLGFGTVEAYVRRRKHGTRPRRGVGAPEVHEAVRHGPPSFGAPGDDRRRDGSRSCHAVGPKREISGFQGQSPGFFGRARRAPDGETWIVSLRCQVQRSRPRGLSTRRAEKGGAWCAAEIRPRMPTTPGKTAEVTCDCREMDLEYRIGVGVPCRKKATRCGTGNTWAGCPCYGEPG